MKICDHFIQATKLYVKYVKSRLWRSRFWRSRSCNKCAYAIKAKSCSCTRAHLRGGGGLRGYNPPKFADYFLKSEGKEVERKKMKRDRGGEWLIVNIFLGVEIFRVGLRHFLAGGGGGGENFRGIEKYRGG